MPTMPNWDACKVCKLGLESGQGVYLCVVLIGQHYAELLFCMPCFYEIGRDVAITPGRDLDYLKYDPETRRHMYVIKNVPQ